MRNIMFASCAAIALCGTVSIAAVPVPALAQEQPPVIQTQANPPGAGAPAETPPNPTTAETPVPPALPADPGYKAGPYKGALTAVPAEALGKTYPLCTSRLQDSCVNPGEAGARAPRRSRHLHRS
jgi:hypothetical protein